MDTDTTYENAPRWADQWVAKRSADGNDGPPTDDALRAAFARCVLPLRPEHYPAVRSAIIATAATS